MTADDPSEPVSAPDRASAAGSRPVEQGSRPAARDRTIVIGLTGPIGCGKSTVAGWLAELGATVIDADQVAREVVEPGEPALEAVAEAFGPEVLAADGSLDRATLGRIVFSDPEALLLLESIVHPAVRPRILERIAAASGTGAPAVVVEAIKLVEGGLAELCDEVWLVVCAPAAQRERLASRDEDAAATDARIAAQADIVERLLPSATRVIDTSGSLAETRAVIVDAWAAATSRTESPRT